MTNSHEELQIPERYVEFAKKVVELAGELKIHHLSCTFTPAILAKDWNGDIKFSMQSGRHYEDARKVFIESTTRVWTQI